MSWEHRRAAARAVVSWDLFLEGLIPVACDPIGLVSFLHDDLRALVGPELVEYERRRVLAELGEGALRGRDNPS